MLCLYFMQNYENILERILFVNTILWNEREKFDVR